VVASVLGCSGQPVPLSAQAGSTISIPVMTGLTTSVIGYGGTQVTDYQRGALVFRLDGPTGMELVTRGTSLVYASPTSLAGRGAISGPSQVMSVIDLPANAPVGTHSLYVTRRRIESGVPVEYTFPGYPGQVQILPNQLTVPLGGGGNQIITGTPTPFQAFLGGWVDVSTNVPFVIPDPELRVALSTGVWAVEMTIVYPASVISVTDVLEPPGISVDHLARVWRVEANPGNPGTLNVKAVAGAQGFSRLSLVFVLQNGASQILDPNATTVTITKAYDQNGNAVTASVSSKTIY
jgi:hypothetical protein